MAIIIIAMLDFIGLSRVNCQKFENRNTFKDCLSDTHCIEHQLFKDIYGYVDGDRYINT